VAIDIRRSDGRYVSRAPGITTRHSFSFGKHYDAENVRHGALVVHDEHVLEPGAGFEAHRHRDVEVVSWVLEGALHHQDSLGNRGVLRPGTLQWLHAGAGVEHTESNRSPSHPIEPTRVIQSWLTPIEGDAPHLTHVELSDALTGGELVCGVGWPGAALSIGRPAAGQRVVMPDAPEVHLYVARGSLVLDGTGPLAPGDAARLTYTGRRELVAQQDAEVLVWAASA